MKPSVSTCVMCGAMGALVDDLCATCHNQIFWSSLGRVSAIPPLPDELRGLERPDYGPTEMFGGAGDEYDEPDDDEITCPSCGSADVSYVGEAYDEDEYIGSSYDCNDCGRRFAGFNGMTGSDD